MRKKNKKSKMYQLETKSAVRNTLRRDIITIKKNIIIIHRKKILMIYIPLGQIDQIQTEKSPLLHFNM